MSDREVVEQFARYCASFRKMQQVFDEPFRERGQAFVGGASEKMTISLATGEALVRMALGSGRKMVEGDI